METNNEKYLEFVRPDEYITQPFKELAYLRYKPIRDWTIQEYMIFFKQTMTAQNYILGVKRTFNNVIHAYLQFICIFDVKRSDHSEICWAIHNCIEYMKLKFMVDELQEIDSQTVKAIYDYPINWEPAYTPD